MDYLYLKFLIYFLLIVVSLYLVGASVFSLLKINRVSPKASIFGKVLIGLTLFILTVSIGFTGFKTINLAFLPVFAFLVFEFRKGSSEVKLQDGFDHISFFNWKEILELIAAGFVFYNIRYFLLFDLSGVPLNAHEDYVFYAKSSIFIVENGVENYLFNFVFPSAQGTYPYHYFELWFNGAISYFLSEAALSVLVLVTYPVLTLLTWYVFLSIAERFVVVTIPVMLYSGLFLFFTGYLLPLLNSISFFNSANTFLVNPVTYPKLLTIYIFLGLSTLFFLYRKFNLGIYSMAVLPVIFISTAPVVFTSIILLNLCLFFMLPQNRKAIVKLSIHVFLIALFIGVFYLLFVETEKSFHSSGGNSLVKSIFNLAYLKTIVNIFGGTTLQFITIYFFGFVLLFMLFYRKSFLAGSELKSSFLRFYPILLVPIIYFSGLLFWGLMHKMLDSVQLFSNITIPMFHLLFFILITIGLKANGFKKSLVGVIAIGLLAITFISIKEKRPERIFAEDYFTAVANEAGKLNGLGVYIKDEQEYDSFFAKCPEFAILGGYLSFLSSDFHAVNISAFDIPLNPKDQMYEVEKKLIAISPFVQFTAKQKLEGTFKSVAQSQLDFIDAFHVDYLVISKLASLPVLLESRILKTIVDAKSGERFIVLKKQTEADKRLSQR